MRTVTAPRQAPDPPPSPGARGRTIALAAAAVVVAVAALVLVLANRGSSSSTHTLNADLLVGTLNGTGHGTHLVFAGVEGGSPTGGAVTIDVELQPVADGSAQELSRAHWLCFPITQERLIHCAPPGYLQRGAPDVPLVVYDTNGKTFLGPEDLIRNDTYRGQKCPFEGGGPYHPTPRGYVACHQFPFAAAFRAGYRGTAKEASRGGWFCFPITQERLIHCAPPGYLQRGAPDVPLLVFDSKGLALLGTEDLIRNDVYRSQKCPFEGGGPYHRTPRGYLACHEFPLQRAATSGPVKFSAHIVDRFDDGSITSVDHGTITLGPNGSVSYTGTGVFTGGTRNYHGAKGRYRLSGTVGLQGDGKFTLAGRVKY
jgi:hypothetical protein